MKQNHKLIFSSKYQKQRALTTVRLQNFRWGRTWLYRFHVWIGCFGLFRRNFYLHLRKYCTVAVWLAFNITARIFVYVFVSVEW